MRRVEPGALARRVAQLLVLLTWLGAGSARAQGSMPIDLVWTAPRGCSSAADVRARVRKLLGARDALATALRAEATVTRRRDGTLHLRLRMRVGALIGERNIDGTSCRDLAGSAAIALALLLRSEEPRAQEPPASEPARAAASAQAGTSAGTTPAGATSAGTTPAQAAPQQAASTTPSTPSAPQRSAPVASSPKAARRFHAAVRGPVAAIGFGPLRRPSYGLSLALGAAIERFHIEAEGRLWLPTEVTTDRQAARYGARVERFTVGLRVCRAVAGTRLELAPCASLAVEHVAASGRGANISEREASATWLAAGIGARARLHVLHWLRLVGGLDLALQTARPTLVIEDVGRIAKLLPVSFTVTFGPEWIL